MSALRNFSTQVTAQSEQADPSQVVNSAGGYAFTVSDIQRLERFLIIGTDGGTYYVGERDLTKQNVSFIRKMIKEDARCVLNTTIDVSDKGRAYRNDAAIFVMALLLTDAPAEFKQDVVNTIPQVVRIATHAYELAEFIKNLGGWGRAKRKAIAKWFESKTAEQLAYQAVKYRQRNGYTLRDLMRLAHPKGIDQRVGNFILGKEYMPESEAMGSDILTGFHVMQASRNGNEVISTLKNFPNLPWETIPTEFLKEPAVWKTLFYNGQLKGQALVRNITRLSRNGAFSDLKFAGDVAKALTDSDMIAKSRLHPIQYLLASVTHAEGQLQRNSHDYYNMWGSGRKKDWETVPVIAAALDEGFHKSFKSIVPSNKRTMIALDVSGSMSADANGIDLSAAQVAAAMAMVVARTEPYYTIKGFSSQLVEINISANMSLTEVRNEIRKVNMGGTDCSKPIVWATERGVEIDTFIVYTDNETWAGSIHPYEALKKYRKKMGINAKLVVVGVTATEFTIADPKDRGMLDVVGFDSATPGVIADFSAGRI